MEVIEFNAIKGRYVFEFQELKTEFHSHPVIEILFVDNGLIELSTEESTYEALSLAVIDANIKHRVLARGERVKAIMIEHHNPQVKQVLAHYGIYLKNGLFVSRLEKLTDLNFDQLCESLFNIENDLQYDERVHQVIEYLNAHEIEYDEMTSVLTQISHLSEGRLSHLFKENVGISLKKYLLWSKLKMTISKHLNTKENLFSSLIQSGFYDQPHFSKAFKTMLGISPSKVYK